MSAPRVVVLHGVNLDQLGKRDPAHYGSQTLGDLEHAISQFAHELGIRSVVFEQTNHEGEYVEMLHKVRDTADGLILNPGAWTHYSWAIRDASRSPAPVAGGGAPQRRARPRGLAAAVGDPRPLHRHRRWQGRRRLPRRAPAPPRPRRRGVAHTGASGPPTKGSS